LKNNLRKKSEKKVRK